MITITCDKCGKEIVTSKREVTIIEFTYPILKDTSAIDQDKFHLCMDCSIGMRKEFKHGMVK